MHGGAPAESTRVTEPSQAAAIALFAPTINASVATTALSAAHHCYSIIIAERITIDRGTQRGREESGTEHVAHR